jgi:hypothetical protein
MPESKDDHQPMSGAAALLRMYWMIIGNGALVFLAALIASHKFHTILAPSVAYWAIALSLILARYVDIRHMGGENAEGNRKATMEDWKRYALLVGLVATAGWIVAVAIAMHFTK